MEFLDQIKHPKWQKKRLEILKRDEFSCRSCGDKKSTLNVHHLIYLKNKKLWEYEDRLLITYCDRCHKIWHKSKDEINLLLATDINRLTMYEALLDGMANLKEQDLAKISTLILKLNT